MKEYLSILGKCSLFNGIAEDEYAAMLPCLGAQVKKYQKNEYIFSEGNAARFVGIVLSGQVQIIKQDFYGNRTIVASIAPAELFGESFACAGVEAIPVSAVASENTTVMLIDCRRITQSCSNACSFHSRMILNLLHVMAAKNLIFNQKIEILSKRTTQEKLMTYLLDQAKRAGSNSFTIPFDRQALADFLGVERSALSAEISKLRKEGKLISEKSQFTLPPEL